jgi:hypothetical protein
VAPHTRVLTFVLAVLVVLGAANGASGDPRFHGGRVYVANRACTGRSYRPASIVLACGDAGLYATAIRYRYYGGKKAQAAATLYTHSCIPNCAQSAFHPFPGTITFADVVRCEGTLYYSRARYHFINGAPYGGPASGSARIEPFGENFGRTCGPVLG